MEKEMEVEMEMEMEVAMEMEMEMVMVIFGARKASSELRFASKWLLTSDFEVLDQTATRRAPRAPKKPPRSTRGVLKKLPGGPLEMLWELLEVHKAPQATIVDTFIVPGPPRA